MSSSSSLPSGGHAAPQADADAAANAAAAAAGGGDGPSSHSLANAANVRSAVHLRLIQIRKDNSWGLLATDDELNSAALTEPVLVTLLGLSLPRATMLIGELAQVGVDTIGTLLLAAEDANSDGTLKADALLPSSIEKIVIKAIAKLCERVRVDSAADQVKRLRLDLSKDFATVVAERLTNVQWRLPSDLESQVLHPPMLSSTNIHAPAVVSAHVPGRLGDPAVPCMLLDELGTRSSKGKPLDNRRYMVLWAPSGAGKTRKVLEKLYSEFGVYLVCKKVNDKNFGSTALLSVVADVETFFSELDWNMPIDESTKEHTSVTMRRGAVHQLVDCVAAAYFAVFDAWASWLSQHHPSVKLEPKHWLFAQLFPEVAFGTDVFRTLAFALARECKRPLPIEKYSTKGWPVVVDEAQALHVLLPGKLRAWLNPDPKETRSLLSPVVERLGELYPRTVLAGTGFSMAVAWDDFMSSYLVQSPGDTNEVLFTDFEPLSEDEVEHFLSRALNVKAQKVREAAKWLAGRPRLVNTFVENAVAKNVTIDEYLPRFVADALSADNERGPAAALKRLGSMPAALALKAGKGTLNLFPTVLVDTLYLSYGFEPPAREAVQLVELGLAYAVPGAPRSTQVCRERLILEAGRMTREQDHHGDAAVLLTHLESLQQQTEAMGKVWELLAVPFLLDLLVGGDLEKSKLFGGDGGLLPQAMRGQWTRPSYSFGMFAEKGRSQSDFLPWLREVLTDGSQRVHVFFMDQNAGPDVFIALRHSVLPTWLFTAVSDKFKKEDDVKEALLRLDPALMYHHNRGKPPGQQAGQQRVAKGMEADLPQIQQLLAGKPFLRVLLSPTATYSGVQRRVEVEHGPLLGTSGCSNHVLVVVDKSNAAQVFGKDLADALAAIKR